MSWCIVSAMNRVLVLCALGACGGAKPAQDAPAAKDRRFVLEVGGTVTSRTGAKTPLVATKEIRQGDGLFLTLTTTQPAKLYVAYCDSQQRLAIYPATGNLIGEPGAITRVPATDEFVTDEHTGLEHIFVIATLADLDRSDPKLHALLARAQGAQGTHCTTQLAMTTEQSRGAGDENVPVAADHKHDAQPRAAAPTGGAGIEVDTAQRPLADDDPANEPIARFATQPQVWRPRGFALGNTSSSNTSSSSSDDTGIAIWAITLEHK